MPLLHLNIQDLLELESIVESAEYFKHQRVSGLLSGRHASMLRGRGLDFSEVRKYVLGDDIRNIDWKVTARTRETHTKVFSEEKERPQLVVLDQSLSMLFGSQGDLKANVALKVMAIHGFRALKMGDRFGGILFTNNENQLFRPSRSKNLFQAMLEQALQLNQKLIGQKVKLDQSFQHLEEALFKVLQIAHHDFIINIITDITQITDLGLERLGSLAKSNNVIVTHISDPLDETLPNQRVPMTNTQVQIDWDITKENQSKFHSSYKEDIKVMEKKLLDYRIPLVTFNTMDPIKIQVKTMLNEQYSR